MKQTEQQMAYAQSIDELQRDRRRSRATTRASVYRDVAIVACAVSAGIHAALTPEHLAERRGAGGGFLVSAIVLGLLAIALRVWRSSRLPAAVTAAMFAGLIVAYALAVRTGVPVFQPEPERVDALALATKAIEAAGLLAVLPLLRASRSPATTNERLT